MDASLLLSVGFSLLLFAIFAVFIAKLWWDERNAARKRQALLSMHNENERIQPQNRRRQRVNRIDEDDEESNDDNANNFVNDDFHTNDKKIGKKKLAKLQAKAQRLSEQTERLERKKVEEEQAKIEDEKRKTENKEEERRLNKLKEEKAERKRKEQEEYSKMKVAFSVEEQGFDRLDEVDSENMIQAFLKFVKETKVVYVDELSAKFSLTVDETVSRLQQFINDKLINGVFDDRGKFIYITDDELKAVVKFINQRGRVTVQEIAEYSNRLISLEPVVLNPADNVIS